MGIQKKKPYPKSQFSHPYCFCAGEDLKAWKEHFKAKKIRFEMWGKDLVINFVPQTQERLIEQGWNIKVSKVLREAKCALAGKSST